MSDTTEHGDILREMQEYYHKRAPIYDHSMGYDDPARTIHHQGLLEFLTEWLARREVLEIACGPGYWTSRVSPVVHSITAIDVNESVLAEARRKQYPNDNVSFCLADAYTLDGIRGEFTGAFAVDWWAHVPKSKRADFVRALHSRLVRGAHVVLIDQLPRPDSITGNYDQEGNHYQTRKLPTGESFTVIKNFTPQVEYVELFSSLSCSEIEYREFPEIRRCALRYSTPVLLTPHTEVIG